MTADRIPAIIEVTRTIREFYCEREEGCNRYRGLEDFEEKLMKDAGDISRRVNSLIGEARRNPIYKTDDVERVERLARRTEEKELAAALSSYKAEKERRENFPVDDNEVTERVAYAIAAE